MRGIGIIGRARTGKDTIGERLVSKHGFARVAFADPLKAAVLKANPLYSLDGKYGRARIADLVDEIGWERAKSSPEVRRTLQAFGQSIRDIDSGFWIRAAMRQARSVGKSGRRPVVITDVRYRNEATALHAAGFVLVHVDRPGVTRLSHESEGALGPQDAQVAIVNDGTVAELHAKTDDIASRMP
ncbi:hypothetical protein [Kitasatospora sp. NPDC088346]|uniref:deoxynucleotide monophosphate kinase family protein n=1 Tax=Kitasatospora sp. NPDC088346 TaxID=3364073 RepID=UPI0037F12630